MHTITSNRSSRNFLDRVYIVPVEGPADERYFHEDLDSMTVLELQREFEKVRLRLLLETRPHHWLLRRYDLLETLVERVRRHVA